MKIEDKRSTTFSVPAVEILDEALPHFQKRNFADIRKAVLLDQNYHKGPPAMGRWLTKQADYPGDQSPCDVTGQSESCNCNKNRTASH